MLAFRFTVRVGRIIGSLAALSCVTLTARPAAAQTGVTCEPPKSSNEAKLLAFFATPIAFSPGGMLADMRPGQIRVGFDAAYVPSPSREIQQPEACYGIKKTDWERAHRGGLGR